jgi:XTP/dITP diphosphohydrolase
LPSRSEPARVLLATRSEDKAREIRAILASLTHCVLLSLDEAGVPPDPAEDAIESFFTYHENALAKARYFAARTQMPTLADDSGREVDALNGAPGVHSKRFSGTSARGQALDDANNAELLRRLEGTPAAERTARYRCAAALATADTHATIALGSCHGTILSAPQGTQGFGYDPLFHLPPLNTTFANLSPDQKNQHSHRAQAFRALAATWPL